MQHKNSSLKIIANKFQENIKRQIANFECFLVWSLNCLKFRFTNFKFFIGDRIYYLKSIVRYHNYRIDL